MRIAKAVHDGNWRKARCLQRLLTRSFYAKLLAVKRVTSNKGKRTPGVDKVLWTTDRMKFDAALSLGNKGYNPKPLRRVYIEKKNGKLRPLGIPTMRDRAMQALHAMALEPIAETTADPNSYGFRPYRSTRDAIGQCFCSLAKKYSPIWVLEADIKGCFDNISHEWLIANIPMNKQILSKWLKAGFIDKGIFNKTSGGTPQGGIISPLLANMTLDGLEREVKSVANTKSKINVIRYADDFIVTGKSRELLEEWVMPAITTFLKKRGLLLSPEKTKIVTISEGFDFLGQNIRKYKNKLIIQPSKSSRKSLLVKINAIMKSNRGNNLCKLLGTLNPVIRGWSNYHRHVCSGSVFANVDYHIFQNVLRWARRGNGKSYKWFMERHYQKFDGQKRIVSRPKDTSKPVVLYYARDVKIVRYIKVKAVSNPFLHQWASYFAMRGIASNTGSIR
jgi:RNA-directed DNA polymerase